MASKSEAAAQAKALKDRALPAKESGLFRQLLQHYENKQHKLGIKTADQILKKFPNHGETLAIKSLVLHSSLPYNHPTATSQPKGEESERLIATALRKDPYSHITHHVNSIILRANKEFGGAADALRRARSIDPDNVPLIRDSISLYTQLGAYEEAQEARLKYQIMRPQLKANWIATAVGWELCGKKDEALKTFQQFESTIKESGYDKVEKAELAMHILVLMVELGKFEDALEKLTRDVASSTLPNTSDVMQVEAKIYRNMDQKDKAEEVYRKLIEMNPDNLGYYRELLSLKGYNIDETVPPEQLTKVLTILDGIAESYPKAAAPRRLVLNIVEGDEFRSRLQPYMQKAIEKGVPSLFSDLKGLFTDVEKQKIAESIGLELQQKYDSQKDGSEAALWSYYYLAQNFSHRTNPKKDYPRSLDLLQKAQERYPTVPELPFARGHVLKRAGDTEGAARALEEARLMDKSDRFLNGKSGKYWLRTGQIDKASSVFGLFTKKDAATPGADLKDMQCLWYLLEEGDAYRRAGNLPAAVKRYEQVIAAFQEFEDDNYDFHTYSLRKLTLNAYIRMIEFNKTFRQHPRYLRAARSACEIYAQIYDQPELRVIKLSAEEEAEKKRAAKKAQKAGSKAKKATPAAAAAADSKKEEPTLPDADPEGAQYLKDVDPLQAMELLIKPLQSNPSAESAFLEFELAIRRKQYLRALRALSITSKAKPDHPKLHEQIVSLAVLLRGEESKTVDAFVIEEFSKYLAADANLTRYNADYLQRYPDAPHIFSAAKSMFKILSAQKDGIPADEKRQVEETLSQLVSSEVEPDLTIYKQALKFHVNPLESSEEARTAFLTKIRKALPLGYDFEELSKIAARRETWGKEDAEKHAATNGESKKD